VHGNNRERKHVEWNFKSLTSGSPSSSGQPLVHLTDLARQLRYVAPVTFNVDVEVELDVRCCVIRGEADMEWLPASCVKVK